MQNNKEAVLLVPANIARKARQLYAVGKWQEAYELISDSAFILTHGLETLYEKEKARRTKTNGARNKRNNSLGRNSGVKSL